MGQMGIVYFVLKIKQFYMIDNCIIEIRSISSYCCETCLNRTSLELKFVFRKDKCSVN